MDPFWCRFYLSDSYPNCLFLRASSNFVAWIRSCWLLGLTCKLTLSDYYSVKGDLEWPLNVVCWQFDWVRLITQTQLEFHVRFIRQHFQSNNVFDIPNRIKMSSTHSTFLIGNHIASNMICTKTCQVLAPPKTWGGLHHWFVRQATISKMSKPFRRTMSRRLKTWESWAWEAKDDSQRNVGFVSTCPDVTFRVGCLQSDRNQPPN